MTNSKTTKRALVLSLLSLLLCCSMLVGTTFAWFTDSVTSGNNTIVAGNLDVELEYLVDGTWTKVTENTNVFEENTLWEPGHTEVVYLRVSNAGTLAFDYKLGVNIVEETSSINVNNEKLTLSEHIVMGVVDDRAEAYGSREAARAALDEDAVKALKAGYATEGTLYAKGTTEPSEKYLALVVYMPETVGNEANYKTGEAIPTIVLGLNLLATQETYEKDSWDEMYDKDASTSVPTIEPTKDTIDVTIFDPFDAGKPTTELTGLTLDIYDFVATEYSSAYPVDEYKDWTCDFFVSSDKPINDGLVLVGNYGTYGWLGFWAPASTEAYEPTALLGAVSSGGESNWTYEDICNDVQIFRCGLLDYEGQNSGTKITVELRMTSPDASETIVVRSITVTLP